MSKHMTTEGGEQIPVSAYDKESSGKKWAGRIILIAIAARLFTANISALITELQNS